MVVEAPARVFFHPVAGVVCASVLFGTSGTARTFLPDGASNLTVAAMRLALGVVPLVIFAHASDRGGWRRPTPEVLGAGLAMAAFQVLFFQSVTSNGVAVGTMVTIGSSPLLALLFERVLSGVAIGKRMFGVVVAVSGLVLLVLGSTDPVETGISALGVLSGVGAGGCWAIYTHWSKNVMTSGWRGSMVMAQTFFVAAVVLAPFLFFGSLEWVEGVAPIATILYLGVATIAVPYLLYSVSLAVLPSATVVTLTLVEPLTAMLLGAVYLNESVGPVSWLGAAVVLYGLIRTGRDSIVS